MNILSFFKRVFTLTKNREDLHLVMYTRGGCHLCEIAWKELTRVQERYRFVLEQRDVDADPALAARYGACVPVVTVNGKERFRGAINPILLKRLLDAACGLAA